jgi:hypothetical protein
VTILHDVLTFQLLVLKVLVTSAGIRPVVRGVSSASVRKHGCSRKGEFTRAQD